MNYLKIQDNFVKAAYEDEVKRLFSAEMLKNYEIVKVTGDVTSDLILLGIKKRFNFKVMKVTKTPRPEGHINRRWFLLERTFEGEEQTSDFKMVQIGYLPLKR